MLPAFDLEGHRGCRGLMPENTIPAMLRAIDLGITTLEIKSGYGLNFENERKLLQVINFLNEIYPIEIVPTFLGAHTFPKEFKDNRR